MKPNPQSSSLAHRLLPLALFSFLLPAPAATAHDFRLTETLLLLRSDGTYQVDMTCDLDALALGAPSGADSLALAMTLSALDPADLEATRTRLTRFFERRVRVFFDGAPARPMVSFPEYSDLRPKNPLAPTVFGLTARLEGRVPGGAEEVSFRASRSLPPVHLTVLHQMSLGGRRELLEPGGNSTPFPLNGEKRPSTADTTPRTVGRYVVLGFWHIVPAGLDHILFVLGLFLLTARLRPLLWQVTAFTVAHAMTLSLGTFGIVQLPARIVEPLIALSIAGIALENLFTQELKPWRPVVVFVFGLLHGLGFSGVLTELGLSGGERFSALVAFNLGIEFGQLLVLAVAFLLIGWWRQRAWYRPRLTVPLSLLIAVAGAWWTVERILAG
jgi:hypothetical protein